MLTYYIVKAQAKNPLVDEPNRKHSEVARVRQLGAAVACAHEQRKAHPTFTFWIDEIQVGDVGEL